MVLQDEFHFSDTLHGYLYGGWGSISHPTRTWYASVIAVPIDLDGFGVLPVLDLDFNTSKLYASSLYGKIFYSQKNGQIWIEQITPITDPIYSISFLNNNQGIAISDQKVLYTDNGGFVGIGEINDLNSSVRIYPNPTTDIIILEINTSDLLKSINIIDMSGKFIKAHDKTDRALDIKGLNAGKYFIRIETEKEILTKKIIIK